jgi:hypothetical protein
VPRRFAALFSPGCGLRMWWISGSVANGSQTPRCQNSWARQTDGGSGYFLRRMHVPTSRDGSDSAEIHPPAGTSQADNPGDHPNPAMGAFPLHAVAASRQGGNIRRLA